jgi:hypothetical protein
LQLSQHSLADCVSFAKIDCVRYIPDEICGKGSSNQDCAYSRPSAPDFDCTGNQSQFAVCFSATAVYVAVDNWVLNSKIDEGIGDAVEKFYYTLRNVGFP